jgi:hypothetical protein
MGASDRAEQRTTARILRWGCGCSLSRWKHKRSGQSSRSSEKARYDFVAGPSGRPFSETLADGITGEERQSLGIATRDCAFVVHSIELGLEVLSLLVRSLSRSRWDTATTLLRVRITPAAEPMIVRSICVSTKRPQAPLWAICRRPSSAVPDLETTAVLVLGRTTGTLDRLEGRQFGTVADAVARFESTSRPGERGSPDRASRRIATPASGHPPPAEAPSCGGLCTP